MLLAVAGLNPLELQQRVQVLASGDWSSFSARERLVLFYAKRLSQDPAGIRAEELRSLMDHWGKERTLDFVWHISWCNFMTRVADAFQIPLESENVFLPLEHRPR